MKSHYLASRIVERMPRHIHYVELYGGGAVLLARDPLDQALWLPGKRGVTEVANDLNGQLSNFWDVLRSETLFSEFKRIVETNSLPRADPQRTHSHNHDGRPSVAEAAAFFIYCRQSPAGNFKDSASMTRTAARRQKPRKVSKWLRSIEGLVAVHERLKRVLLENAPVIKLIQQQDGPGTLFYCDPRDLHETCSTTDACGNEMTEADHRELLNVLKKCRGKVMLSGYPSGLYDQTLSDWNRHTFDMSNHAAGGGQKGQETEVLWVNY
jgi:DNA adenine methylase